MTDETTDELCKDCGPTLTAFLEQMAEHNLEKMAEHSAKVTCPTCGKVHIIFPEAVRQARARKS